MIVAFWFLTNCSDEKHSFQTNRYHQTIVPFNFILPFIFYIPLKLYSSLEFLLEDEFSLESCTVFGTRCSKFRTTLQRQQSVSSAIFGKKGKSSLSRKHLLEKLGLKKRQRWCRKPGDKAAGWMNACWCLLGQVHFFSTIVTSSGH